MVEFENRHDEIRGIYIKPPRYQTTYVIPDFVIFHNLDQL